MSHMGIYLRNGKWYYRTRVKGRLHRESLAKYGITTIEQAQAYVREIEPTDLKARLARLDPSRVTLGAFRDEYLAHREPLNLSPHTKRQDAKALASIIGVLGEGCRLATINQKKVDGWVGIMLGRGRSPRTINSYLSHIRAALNTAAEWGRLEKPPRLKLIKAPQTLPRALTPEEVEHILAKELLPARRALWEFILWTGARRQEVIDLQWKDVDLKSDAPRVRFLGKGEKERLVPLMPDAVRALGAMPASDVGPVWIFSSRHHKTGSVAGSTISRWFKATARAAGIEDAHLHDLRHTAATWMAVRGVAEHVIQEILGHASITTTQIYTKGMARIADLYEAMRHGLK